MIHSHDYKVWIGLEQRLDGLTSRWGPDPYVTVVLDSKDDRIEFNLSTSMATLLARGLNKTVKLTKATK